MAIDPEYQKCHMHSFDWKSGWLGVQEKQRRTFGSYTARPWGGIGSHIKGSFGLGWRMQTVGGFFLLHSRLFKKVVHLLSSEENKQGWGTCLEDEALKITTHSQNREMFLSQYNVSVYLTDCTAAGEGAWVWEGACTHLL